MREKSGETIQMVERAMRVLDTLRLARERFGVNEIAKRCGMLPSTTYRILKTLEQGGWVFQCADDRYITGEKLSFVTEQSNLLLALKDVAAHTMTRCTAEHGRVMNLMVRDGQHCYILQQSRTQNLVDYVAPLYAALPIHACAGGKILLAELPISLVDQLLESSEMVALTPHTITNADDFWKELRQVARQGYAFDFLESSQCGSCIAVPVRDNRGNTIAALSFSGFTTVKDPQELVPFVPALKKASEEITKNLYQCWKE